MWPSSLPQHSSDWSYSRANIWEGNNFMSKFTRTMLVPSFIGKSLRIKALHNQDHWSVKKLAHEILNWQRLISKTSSVKVSGSMREYLHDQPPQVYIYSVQIIWWTKLGNHLLLHDVNGIAKVKIIISKNSIHVNFNWEVVAHKMNTLGSNFSLRLISHNYHIRSSHIISKTMKSTTLFQLVHKCGSKIFSHP